MCNLGFLYYRARLKLPWKPFVAVSWMTWLWTDDDRILLFSKFSLYTEFKPKLAQANGTLNLHNFIWHVSLSLSRWPLLSSATMLGPNSSWVLIATKKHCWRLFRESAIKEETLRQVRTAQWQDYSGDSYCNSLCLALFISRTFSL